MKKIMTILALCLMSLTSWVAAEANAQNKIFSKYSEVDNVDYVCITKSMLKLVGRKSATINGVHIDGITDAIDVVLIISSGDEKSMAMMKSDYDRLSADPDYELLMQVTSNGERVSKFLNSTGKVKEMVMHIGGAQKQVFIVLSGQFSADQLSKLLKGSN